MPLAKFVIYTFVGSLLWCWALAWVGEKLGEHWDGLGIYFHRFDEAIGLLIIAGAAWWIWRHVRHLRRG
jgi:membrane protein DedA with SNARE-associated domain